MYSVILIVVIMLFLHVIQYSILYANYIYLSTHTNTNTQIHFICIICMFINTRMRQEGMGWDRGSGWGGGEEHRITYSYSNKNLRVDILPYSKLALNISTVTMLNMLLLLS